jgi:pyrimidine-nucleoside phosphorylase
MRAVDLIRRKRDGAELEPDEISFLVRGFTAGEIPDYQVSALLMAIVFRGMSEPETAALTEAMRRSGVILDLSDIPGAKVDKHSTGGVGDKPSLVVAPAVAAAGLTVPMISGRGLGHTGGTLDKLESIPGFDVQLDLERFRKILRSIGVALIGQTADLVPADRKLYSLRDVTATIDCIPLIVASIMSKKLVEGIGGLVLDVKTGSGAFMKQLEDSERLARAMVDIGSRCGTTVVALVTDMNQPLGEFAGNAVEVVEALEVLKGRGPSDLCALCRELSAWCILLGGGAPTIEAARSVYDEMIRSGKALDRFRRVVELQGGDVRVVDDYSRLPQAQYRSPLASPAAGFVASMDTERIGLALAVLGAGRETVESRIDPAVGIQFSKKVSDEVAEGEALCTLLYNDAARRDEAERMLREAYRFSPAPVPQPQLIRKVIQ